MVTPKPLAPSVPPAPHPFCGTPIMDICITCGLDREHSAHSAPSVPPEIVHWCPKGDEALTQCCRRSPFELPRTARLTTDRALVTCALAEENQVDQKADGA